MALVYVFVCQEEVARLDCGFIFYILYSLYFDRIKTVELNIKVIKFFVTSSIIPLD